jgi:hypothetical protein
MVKSSGHIKLNWSPGMSSNDIFLVKNKWLKKSAARPCADFVDLRGRDFEAAWTRLTSETDGYKVKAQN